MRRLTVILVVVLLIVSTSLSFVGPRKLGGDYLQQGNSLSRQAEFSRFIHEAGFTEQQLREINLLVENTLTSLQEAHDEVIALMERAVHEAVAGDIDKSRETEKEARQIAAESRSCVQDFVASMRNIVTVAQQEKMLELLGSLVDQRFPAFSQCTQDIGRDFLMNRSDHLAARYQSQEYARARLHFAQTKNPFNPRITGRLHPRTDLFDMNEEMPGERILRVLPEDARKVVQDRLRENFPMLEQMLPKVRERSISTSIREPDMIYLMFLQEDNSEVIRRIVEQ